MPFGCQPKKDRRIEGLCTRPCPLGFRVQGFINENEQPNRAKSLASRVPGRGNFSLRGCVEFCKHSTSNIGALIIRIGLAGPLSIIIIV